MCAAAASPCFAQDPNALARTGLDAIEAGRFGDALDAFTKAAAGRPDDAGLCFGAGIAAFMLGRDEVAQARFECALANRPGHLPATKWLGDLHYRAGRLQEAISVYRAALQRTPERDLQAQLDEWRNELALESRFREIRTEHFTARFEHEVDEPLARAVIARLEVAHCRIREALGVSPSQPITVVLYSREQFSGVTKLADWSVAAYDGRIRVPLSALDEPDEIDRVLSHELVHAVIVRLGGRAVPAWLNEGLATVLEPAGSGDVEATLARTSAQPALTKLQKGFVGLSRRDAEVAYASAARAVRLLVEQRGLAPVVALLQDLARGEPFPDAFRRRLTMRYDEFARLVARQ